MPLALGWTKTATLPRSEGAAVSPVVPPVQETDLDRILKLIPTEVIAFYTAAVAITPEVSWRHYPAALFVAGLVLVPIVLFLDGRSTGQAARAAQYVIRTLAFAVWAITIAWPFEAYVPGEGYRWISALGLLVVPLVGALLLRERPQAGPTP